MSDINRQTLASNTPSIASAATALASNPARIGWYIQNLGTNALFVLLGAGASTTVFHKVLKAGAGNDDGSGSEWGQLAGVVYTGLISVAGTSPRYVVLEHAP